MTRYWIEFASPPRDSALNLGCGLTAHDYDDALGLLRERVFKKTGLLDILRVAENVDISTLDQKHVVPNMEVPIYRGIWFPKGFPG
jgi:hypothetical protein